jgi:hypothetical protein
LVVHFLAQRARILPSRYYGYGPLVPYDWHDHSSHTMGTMLGSDSDVIASFSRRGPAAMGLLSQMISLVVWLPSLPQLPGDRLAAICMGIGGANLASRLCTGFAPNLLTSF